MEYLGFQNLKLHQSNGITEINYIGQTCKVHLTRSREHALWIRGCADVKLPFTLCMTRGEELLSPSNFSRCLPGRKEFKGSTAWESTLRGGSMVECRLSATAPLDRCVFYWFISSNITAVITLLFLYL